GPTTGRASPPPRIGRVTGLSAARLWPSTADALAASMEPRTLRRLCIASSVMVSLVWLPHLGSLVFSLFPCVMLLRGGRSFCSLSPPHCFRMPHFHKRRETQRLVAPSTPMRCPCSLVFSLFFGASFLQER